MADPSTVPGYTGAPSVSPESGVGFAQLSDRGATPEAFGVNVAEAGQRLGRAISQVGEVGVDYALRQQKIYNEAVTKDLDVSSMEKLGQATTDFYSQKGKAAVEAHPEYVKAVQEIRKDALAAAPNQEVARMLDQQLSRRVGFALIDGGRHLATELKGYALHTSDARIALEQSNAATAGTDNAFKNSAATVAAEVDSKAQLLGWSPEQTLLEKKKAIGTSLAGHISAISQTDPTRGQRLLDQNKDSIDGDSYQKIQQNLVSQQRNIGSRQIADELVMGGLPRTEDRENYLMSRLTNIVGKNGAAGLVGNFHRESGLNTTAIARGDGADGSDSIGIAQWNAERARALKQFATEQGKSPTDFRVQAAFVEKELSEKPDLVVMLKGAKTPEEAARIANRYYEVSADQPGSPAMREREAHATRLAGKDVVISQQGITPSTTPGQLDSLVQQARAVSEARLPGDPIMADMAEARVRTTYANVKRGAADALAANKDAIQKYLYSDPDHPPSMDTLMMEPEFKQAFDNFQASDPKSASNITRAVQRLHDNPPMTDERRDRLTELAGMADRDPQGFVKINLWDEDLGRRDIQKLITQQAKLKGVMEDDPQTGAALTMLQREGRLDGSGIDISKKKDNKPLHMFTGQLSNLLKAEQEQTGKYPDDEKVKAMAGSLLKEQPDTGFLGFGRSRLYEVDVPKDWREGIIQSYQKNRKPVPSDEQIKNEYIRIMRQKEVRNAPR